MLPADRAFGERWIEGVFRRAPAMGNDVGYDSIVGGGAHATTLHWIDNTGAHHPGELVLLDMGVEGRNLYTADVTRTLPVDGTFTPLQRELYDLVYALAAGRHRRRQARRRRSTTSHDAAMRRARPRPRRPGPAARLGVEEALDPDVEGLPPLDAARLQPHARHGRARLRATPARRTTARARSARAWC